MALSANYAVHRTVSCVPIALQKSAGEILEAVVEDGYEDLDRANTGLALSGFAGGLNISFGALALGVAGLLLADRSSSWHSQSGGGCQGYHSRIFFIYVLALPIPLGGLTHCIAGSADVLIRVSAGEATFLEYPGLFRIPPTLDKARWRRIWTPLVPSGPTRYG